MKKQQIVQIVPDKMFLTLMRYAFGEQRFSIIEGFGHLTLIQPIKIDGKSLNIGLNRDFYESHFFLLDPEKTGKKSKILTIFAGRVVGIHGGKQTFKNKVYFDVLGKVDSQQNFLHAITVIAQELDAVVRNIGLKELPESVPLEEVKQLKIITKNEKVIFL